MEWLLRVLRGEATDWGAEDAEWDAALALAEEEGVLLWLAHCLRMQGVAQPGEMDGQLKEIEREAAMAAFYWGSELKGVLRAFDSAGIAALPLKGPMLAERVYGGAALRSCRDLDVLVSRADLGRAEDALAEAGFCGGVADDYHRPWQRGTTLVELHRDVENPLSFNFDVEGALQRAESAEFQGVRCLRLTPEDELLLLCLHGVRHRFERLSLVLDIQLTLERLELDGLPAQGGELDRVLALGMAMALRLRPERATPAVLHEAVPRDEQLEEVADRLWARLMTRPGEQLDWRAMHAFYLEIERPGWPRWRRRVRHLRILAGRVIEPDLHFASRFGLRRAWQAWLLRPMRLAWELTRR
jgi:hypothetical protein